MGLTALDWGAVRPAAPRRAPASLAGLLDVVAPHVPAALVPAAGLARARGTLERLSAGLAACAYLECRLDAGDPRVDLILNVERPGRALLAAGRGPLNAAVAARPAWSRAAALAADWASPASPLHEAVGMGWLEFDLDHRDDLSALDPGVFVDFRREVAAAATVRVQEALVARALRPLMEGGAPEGVMLGVRRCAAHLPPGACVHYMGWLPRGTGSVRLCLVGIPDALLPGYLRDCGWEGSQERLAALIAGARDARLHTPHPGVGLVHVDVRDGRVLPRVGLEFIFGRRSQAYGTLADAPFLRRLSAAGMCDPGKADALLRWPGVSTGVVSPDPSPCVVARRVNHVKVMFQGDRAVEAKAYLCWYARPRDLTPRRVQPEAL